MNYKVLTAATTDTQIQKVSNKLSDTKLQKNKISYDNYSPAIQAVQNLPDKICALSEWFIIITIICNSTSVPDKIPAADKLNKEAY